MYIRKFTYTAENVDCRLCTEVIGKNGCRQEVCPYLAERIEAGVISYGEALLTLFPSYCGIRTRFPQLIAGFSDSLWLDKKHKRSSVPIPERTAAF